AGRLFENVSLPTIEPAIDSATAASAAEVAQGDGAVAGVPELGVLAAADHYVLVYRMEIRSSFDIQTYDIDASNGRVVQHLSRIQTQQAVGKGTGVLGDQKKVSASAVASLFRTTDRLRP